MSKIMLAIFIILFMLFISHWRVNKWILRNWIAKDAYDEEEKALKELKEIFQKSKGEM